MSNRKTFFRRVSIAFLGVLLVFTGMSMQPAPRAEASGLPVADFLNYIKNTVTAASGVSTAGSTGALVVKGYVLDPLAWMVAKAVLNSVIQSTVKWINSGFQGSPAFVTNLDQTLLTTANSTADAFVNQLLTNGSIKSPFQSQVGTAVASTYNKNTNGGFFTANAYTLNQVSSNPAGFLAGNFSQGGINAWNAVVSNPANNPYGATMLASNALNSQIGTAQSNQKTELNWGNGFGAFKGNCNAPKTSSTGSVSLSTTNTCATASTLTPGSVIANTTYKALGSGFDQLVSAQSFGQLVNALIGQLTKQVLGGGGLSGVSQPSSSTGSSYLDQISASQTAATNSTAASFAATISSQTTQLQAFQQQWTIINNAALAAQSAVAASTCYAASSTAALANTIQPTLAQAATELANAKTSIASLQNIQTEASPTTSTGTANSTTQIAQASADYSTLLASNTLPSASDIQYAQTQSQNTGAADNQSLYTQLTQITQAASTCSVPH